MITLYTFHPAHGLPDLSPFVVKTMMLLKLAGLDYVEDGGGFARAPKKKLPYIDDNGTIVADSTLIRFHLEKTRGVDFDAGLTDAQRAMGWTIEKMCEEHLYWIIVHTRWMEDANFERGPARLFDEAPPPVRWFVKRVIRGKVAKACWAQGVGRLTREERDELGRRDVDALSVLLGDGPFLFGAHPCAADAALFGFLAAVLAPNVDSAVNEAALQKSNLVAYRDRIMATYFLKTASPDEAA